MLTQVSKTGKIIKEVFIIRRYEIKRGTMAGSICNVVRSVKTVKGQQVVNEYQVWTLRDGVTTCDCPSKVPCCHMDEVSFSELRYTRHIQPSHQSTVTPAPAQSTRELRVVVWAGDYMPQYRDNGGAWQFFKNEQGRNIGFLGGYESLAWKFIAVDSDEHRSAVLAELAQSITDSEAYIAKCDAEEARRKAESDRRKNSTLNGSRGIQLCKSWKELEAERAARQAVA